MEKGTRVGDANLKLLEDELKVKIALKPQGLVITGDKFHVRKAGEFLHKLDQLEHDGFNLSREDIYRYLNFDKIEEYQKSAERIIPIAPEA